MAFTIFLFTYLQYIQEKWLTVFLEVLESVTAHIISLFSLLPVMLSNYDVLLRSLTSNADVCLFLSENCNVHWRLSEYDEILSCLLYSPIENSDIRLGISFVKFWYSPWVCLLRIVTSVQFQLKFTTFNLDFSVMNCDIRLLWLILNILTFVLQLKIKIIYWSFRQWKVVKEYVCVLPANWNL